MKLQLLLSICEYIKECFLFVLLLCSASLIAQTTFHVEVTGLGDPFIFLIVPPLIDASSEGGALLVEGSLNDEIHIVELNEFGLIQNAWNIDATIYQNEPYSAVVDAFESLGTQYLFIVGLHNGVTDDYKTGLLFTDIENSVYWGKLLSDSYMWKIEASFLSEGYVLMQHHLSDAASSVPDTLISLDSLGLGMLSAETGDPLWLYFYKVNDLPLSRTYHAISFDVFPDGDISVLGGEDADFPIVWQKNFYLLRIDTLGNVIYSKGLIAGDDIQVRGHVIDGQGNVYLSGRFWDGTSLTMHGEPFYTAFIAKLDELYNVVWVKTFLIEEYYCADFDLHELPSGNLLFLIRSYGDFPVIIGEMSSAGELLWYKGRGVYDPRISIGEDGGVYFVSGKKYFPDGSWVPGLLVGKANQTGEIANCPSFDACIEIEANLDFDLDSWSWSRSSGVAPEDVPFDIVSFDAESLPYCGVPPYPVPQFDLPDTVCVQDCLSLTDLPNFSANSVRWDVVGPGIDTSIWGLDLSWCFSSVGVYEVSQTVWALGCWDMHTEEIVVLSEYEESPLGADRTLCEEPPFSLSANAERPLLSYLWSDGSTAPELEVSSSGTYSLEASDGYCTLRDTVELIFLQDLLTQGPPLTLPADTVVCEQHLPYVLAPYSPYTEIPSQQLWQAGSYAVEAEVFGCPVFEDFEFSLSDCRSRIYFPTAFSPNGDGLNDQFLPQGKDYEGIELQVYDRWGGLLYSAREAPFAWDGGDASPGVYTWLFRYLNTLSGEEEVLSGEVNLVE